MSSATSRRSTCSLTDGRRSAIASAVEAAGAIGGRDELVEGRGGVAALAAQLHLALVDDDLAQEGTWVADRLAVALLHPRGRDRDLEEVAEGVTPPRAAEPEWPGERHEQRGLELAVVGEPVARVARGWYCCRAHVCLPGCEVLKRTRCARPLESSCDRGLVHVVALSVREPEVPR